MNWLISSTSGEDAVMLKTPVEALYELKSTLTSCFFDASRMDLLIYESGTG